MAGRKWDPTMSVIKQTLSPMCLDRIKKDIKDMFKDAPPGMSIAPDESDITLIHALLMGPSETPYEGGFFYFIIRCPSDYPIRPPQVKLMTTGALSVRFNPNLYSNGKVCLSIIGTWRGPPWSPAQSLTSLLLSIQSLMNDKPYHNEPGREKELLPGQSDLYNQIIRHETLRVAVCDMLEGTTSDSRNFPQSLRDEMEKMFLEKYEYYVSTAKANSHLNAKQMQDPFHENRGSFNYSKILERLANIKAKLDANPVKLETKRAHEEDSESDKSNAKRSDPGYQSDDSEFFEFIYDD